MEADTNGGFRELLRHFLRQASAQSQRLIRDTPLTLSQCHVLMEIESRRETTVGELAGCLRLDKSTLSRAVDSLIALGFVTREPFANDRRFNRVSLSEGGRAICGRINEAHDRDLDEIFGRVEGRERDEIIACFHKLVEAFELGSSDDEIGRGKAAADG
jgi:DNA-binding MarR family transcriptional regulator